ncbi:MAG: hypothetical protein WCV73_01675 [Patescibacteria group bacterium]|jgi:hypothetical protein
MNEIFKNTLTAKEHPEQENPEDLEILADIDREMLADIDTLFPGLSSEERAERLQSVKEKDKVWIQKEVGKRKRALERSSSEYKQSPEEALLTEMDQAWQNLSPQERIDVLRAAEQDELYFNRLEDMSVSQYANANRINIYKDEEQVLNKRVLWSGPTAIVRKLYNPQNHQFEIKDLEVPAELKDKNFQQIQMAAIWRQLSVDERFNILRSYCDRNDKKEVNTNWSEANLKPFIPYSDFGLSLMAKSDDFRKVDEDLRDCLNDPASVIIDKFVTAKEAVNSNIRNMDNNEKSNLAQGLGITPEELDEITKK